MELAVDRVSVLVDQLEGVRAVAVHVPVPDGGAAVGEEEGHLVGRLLPQGDEVPEGVRVLAVRHRVPLLRVDEAREEDGVADEEDGRVVAHQVPVALAGVELAGEAAGVPVEGGGGGRKVRQASDRVATA